MAVDADVLPGYRLTDVLHQGARTRVYRAVRTRDDQPVVLKLLVASHSARAVARFRREFEIARRFDAPEVAGVVRALELARVDERWMISMEDTGSRSLERVLAERRPGQDEVLRLAIGIAEALAAVHDQTIIHKDINPSNIIYREGPGAVQLVQLIDFGISSEISRERPFITNPNHLEGTLEYVAPEQTGRVNRSIDRRADMYSLGVTLYRLATGALPFSSRDPLALIHAHLAKNPVPAHELAPRVDPALSRIIAILMAKDPADRYHSARGLLADLRACQGRQGQDAASAEMVLRAHDRTSVFHIPDRLYGRDREIASLLAAFERVAAGRAEVVVVRGRSGIGKSALVHEVERPLTGHRGLFAMGKFDQFRRDIPYEPLLHAFRDLIRDILTGDEAQVDGWRERMALALGQNRGIIAELIPEFAQLVGAPPPVPELGPTEARNRFRYTVEQFARVFTARDHPLALFLDDVQWADRPSVELLEGLAGEDARSLLLVLSYRDDEVDDAHPVAALLANLQQRGVSVTTLDIGPLAHADIARLLADTLHQPVDAVVELARIAGDKTGGSPFFLGQFLRVLHDEDHLAFSWDAGRWTWDDAAIAALPVSDNVVDLVVGQISSLSEECRRALAYAACLGGEFALHPLADAMAVSPAEAGRQLWDAVSLNLLIPLSPEYRFVGGSDEYAPDIPYRFVHDRVRDGARAQLSEHERRRVHLRVGRALKARLCDDNLFDAVSHLIEARALLTADDERVELARLALAAGRRATRSASYQAAQGFLATGIALLAELAGDPWQVEHALMLALHDASIEAAYIAADYDELDRRAHALIRACPDPLEQVTAHEALIQSLSERLHMLEAVALGRRFLARLGMSIPAPIRVPRLLLELQRTRRALARGGLARLCELPELGDERLIASNRIMAAMLIGAFSCEPQLMAVITARQVRIALAHGLCAEAVFGLVTHALVLAGPLGQPAAACEIARAACALTDQRDYHRVSTRVHYVANGYLGPWRDPLPACSDALDRLFTRGQSLGDNEFASYASGMAFVQRLFRVDVGAQLRDAVIRRQTVIKLGRLTAGYLADLVAQLLANIAGETRDPVCLTGEYLQDDESAALAQFRADDDDVALMLVYVGKTFTAAIHGDVATAAAAYRDSAPHRLSQSAWAPAFPWFRILGVVCSLAAAGEPGSRRARAAVRAVRREFRYLRKIAALSRENYGFGIELARAERARLLGRAEAARDHYRRAIERARDGQLIGLEALCRERQARFLLAAGDRELGAFAMTRARQVYELWGAGAKLRLLDAEFPALAPAADGALAPGASLTTGSSTAPSSTGEGGAELDLTSVLKAAQAIAGELELSGLIRRLLSIVMENAGADNARLVLAAGERDARHGRGERDDRLAAAERSLVVHAPDGGETPLARAGDELPRALVKAAWRDAQPVIVHDAGAEPGHQGDPYLQTHGVRSILCLPIVHQGHTRAVLYLENRQLAGVFTPERLTVLDVLAAQTAIAIDNASLYQDVEAQVTILEARNREIQQLNDELRRQIAQRSERLMKLLMAREPQVSADAASLEVGSLLGDCYRVLRVIGRGGMGEVYEVERVTDSVRLAAKILRRSPRRSALGRFVREAQILARLSHPNLIAIHDVDITEAGVLYIVMELVSGASLRAANVPEGDLSWRLSMLAQVAEALAVLHEQSIVHRDLKPENILVMSPDPSDESAAPMVKLVDFGIAIVTDDRQTGERAAAVAGPSGPPPGAPERGPAAATAHTEDRPPVLDHTVTELRAADRTPAFTQTGILVGTPHYMAPELAHGSRHAQSASDLFSLGVIAFEYLAGVRPFSQPLVWRGEPDDPAAIPPDLRQLPGLSPALAALFERCLDCDPARRPSASELADRLAPARTVAACDDRR